MATAAEIFNFIDKFAHMTTHGFQANLTFSSNEGRVSVNFNADLGYLMSNSTAFSKEQYGKSTQARRRQRRAQARKQQQSADACVETLPADLVNENSDGARDVTPTTTDNTETNFTSSELTPTVPPMPLSKDDATIEYLISQPTSQSNDPNVLPTLTTPLPTPKYCCPSTCCRKKNSPARNCPGPDVLKTTYISCCYHKK